jgi:hypothetical protein
MTYHITSLAPTRTKSQKRRHFSTTTESSDEFNLGSVGITCWCNVNGSPEHTLMDMFTCLKDDSWLMVKKVYCNFCGDHMGNTIQRCEDCRAYMCKQVHPDSSSCIRAGSVSKNVQFFCIVCDPKHWRQQSNQAWQSTLACCVGLSRADSDTSVITSITSWDSWDPP